MPRQARVAVGGLVYHVLNRAVARLPLFQKRKDFEAFERVLVEAHIRQPIRILAYCLMPNHWHLILHPGKDGELTAFVRRLTHTHTMRWHVHHGTVGTGHLYQGRFKAFPVQTDAHFLTVCRYVERNALRANLVDGAEKWRWGSLWQRLNRAGTHRLLSRWPVDQPRDWVRLVNEPQNEQETGRAPSGDSARLPLRLSDLDDAHRREARHQMHPPPRRTPTHFEKMSCVPIVFGTQIAYFRG